ncbi:unnamed protein product [Notodromas monacha]|uniref:Uncharacterized protein n=1 Tax=Notodromas monacha TaxID=399045 RepID=A0A7R9BS34_9CRUS|nr:unnamed protein product [Notodromas monacha]CAG0919593.1 unnamed protein product [Notodromas monacha]
MNECLAAVVAVVVQVLVPVVPFRESAWLHHHQEEKMRDKSMPVESESGDLNRKDHRQSTTDSANGAHTAINIRKSSSGNSRKRHLVSTKSNNNKSPCHSPTADAANLNVEGQRSVKKISNSLWLGSSSTDSGSGRHQAPSAAVTAPLEKGDATRRPPAPVRDIRQGPIISSKVVVLETTTTNASTTATTMPVLFPASPEDTRGSLTMLATASLLEAAQGTKVSGAVSPHDP